MKKNVNILLMSALVAASTTTAFAADATTSASTATTTEPEVTVSTPITTTTSSNNNYTVTNLPTLSAEPNPSRPLEEGETAYLIVYGDTLEKIATKFDTTYQELAAFNKIEDPNVIYAGQTIIIPAKQDTIIEEPVIEEPVVEPEVVEPVIEEPVVEPEVEEPVVDAVTNPSITADAEELAVALSAEGNWIAGITSDVTVEGVLNIEGTFYNKNDVEKGEYRKLALYDQDEDKNVTANYTLTADINVTSPNTRIQNGIVNGNIVVDAPGFVLKGTEVNGDVVFTSVEYMDSADLSEGTVNGTVKTLKPEVDAVTNPSITADAEELVVALSAEGNWIAGITSDVTIDGELNIDGTFYNKNDVEKGEYRKLALYDQDEDKNVTANHTLTVEKINVTSPNTRIQNGIVNGDIVVSSNGFVLKGTEVNGNVYFTSEEAMNSADLSEGTVNGEVALMQ